MKTKHFTLLRMLTVVAMAVMLGLVTSATQAEVVYNTPDIVCNSIANTSASTYFIGNMVDDDTSSFCVMYDDSASTTGLNGYVVFDMGSVLDLTGFYLAGRASYRPSDVQFFYFDDDVAVNPVNSANITYGEGSGYSLISSHSSLPETTEVFWDETITAQYIGMKINDTTSGTNTQIKEIDFMTGRWVSPEAIVDFSGSESGSYPASNMIDESTTSFNVIYDDTDGGESDTYTTGHVIFDLGETKTIDAVKLTSRYNNASYNPSLTDFFYFADNDPTNNTGLLDDIEGDSDIVLLTSCEFSALLASDSEVVSWASTPLTTRYIGMRVNDAYEDGNFQIADIEFCEIPTEASAVPEPSTIALLLMLVGGFLAIRKR